MDYVVLFIRAVLQLVLIVVLVQLGVSTIKLFLSLPIKAKVIILLSMAVLSKEFHLIVYLIWPQTATITCDIWLDKTYHQVMTVQWYLYSMCEYIENLIWAVSASMMATIISYQLYKITLVFVVFYVTQFCFYCWDRNTSLWDNFWVYLFMGIAIIYAIIPDKKKHEGKYRRIDS